MPTLRVVALHAVIAMLGCDGPRRSSPEREPPLQELRDNTSDARLVIAKAPVKQVTAGDEHTCALLVDGRIRCWGQGASGRLGLSSTDTIGDDEPVSQGRFVALGGPAEQISAGSEHTCALMGTGAVRCWGNGQNGRLGYGSAENIGDNEDPEKAGDVPLNEKALQVVAGDRHTCAVLASGSVRCWGSGAEFRLGYGGEGSLYVDDLGDDEPVMAVPAIALKRKARQIVISSATTCVLLEEGSVRCWGAVGHPRGSEAYERPAHLRPNVQLGVPAVSLGAGSGHICAVTTTQRVRCWGIVGLDETMGYPGVSLVYGERIGGAPTPARLGDVPGISDVAQVDGGDDHTCVLLRAGKVRCWGNARTGALGYGHADRWGGENMVVRNEGDRVRPPDSAELKLPAKARQIVAGVFYTCALLEDDTVRCWGWNEYGQLGYGNKDKVWDASQAPPVPL